MGIGKPLKNSRKLKGRERRGEKKRGAGRTELYWRGRVEREGGQCCIGGGRNECMDRYLGGERQTDRHADRQEDGHTQTDRQVETDMTEIDTDRETDTEKCLEKGAVFQKV